jgi:serine phosphatase RsbU (regulator of sigma subunit)
MELNSPGGVPLGVLDDLKIPAGEVTLEAGDILLLYTDGVTDSTGFERDEQRVRRFFASRLWPTAAAAAGAIIAEAKRGGLEQPDDMSVVVVRIPAVPAPVIVGTDSDASTA